MRILVCNDYQSLSKKAAQIIASQITLNPKSVLGLATGSTPEGLYQNLVNMYQEGTLDFANVKTFNLDEYLNLPFDNEESYHYFMNDKLFNHINIKKENVHVPNGMAEDIESECKNYDKMIDDAGKIDIQLLGIGINAHIGFNEPTINFNVGTHVVTLNESTRNANARFFDSIDDVPTQAVTMGTGSIFKSRKILLLASGQKKAKAIYDSVYGKITPEVPASILQLHQDVIIILDKEAASLLNKEDCEIIPDNTKVSNK